MATSPDARVIDRESLKMGLLERYTTQHVGGTFDAKKASNPTPGNMLEGLQGWMGYTQKSRAWTTEPGIQAVGKYPNKPTENFNTKALNYSDALPGFNTKRYYR